MSHPAVYAVALTSGERDLVVRAVTAYRSEELRRKANVLHMLEYAVDDRDLAALKLAERDLEREAT